MPAKTLAELFLWHLKDLYGAEHQLLKALPDMAKKASTSELREAFETHFKETQNQVQRLDRVFGILGVKPSAEECKALKGLALEADEVMREAKDPGVLDAGLIAGAQAVEHYEIARYGALAAWSDELGYDEASKLLRETLKEEKHADEVLNGIAMKGVNRKAA